jgi:hypothetical protein
MSTPLSIIIVEKTGTLKSLSVKNYNENELYKKCGFKKEDGFLKQTEWQIKLNGQKYFVQMYGKLEGKSNMENKYDFPPPVDTKLFFGSCALVCMIKNGPSDKILHNLTVELWERMYEKLFGGFEDLTLTNKNDEDEEDELENIPSHLKTKKGGYLKDGFVVDSEEDEEDCDDEEWETEEEEFEEDDGEELNELEDIGSELSEESYV